MNFKRSNFKIFNILSWLLVIVGVFVMLGFIHKSQDNMLMKQPIVNIDYETSNRFINEEEVLNQIINPNDSSRKLLTNYNILELEDKINKNSVVKEAQVFKTIDGKLVVNIKQRKPIARVYSRGESYYIDEKGFLMLTSKKYTARVLIVNGFLNEPFTKRYLFNYENVHDTIEKKTMLDDIYKISKFIDESEFWKAQIEQVYVNKDLDFELIPKVGNHKIVFGGVDNIRGKFNKLMIFYQKGLEKTGWNEYSKINLKYKNQVVCTKLYN